VRLVVSGLETPPVLEFQPLLIAAFACLFMPCSRVQVVDMLMALRGYSRRPDARVA
jgi:hypothetical protein